VVKAEGTIYIRPDGSIEPSTAPIYRDGDIYTFTDSIYDEIVVQRSYITIDGAGYTLQSAIPGWGVGIYLTVRNNVTIRNMEIKAFTEGIFLNWLCFYNNIYRVTLTDNRVGIRVDQSSNYNRIYQNNVVNNVLIGVYLDHDSNYNSIYHNNFVDNQMRQASVGVYPSTNVWDDGYPSGGNYWSDYGGVDIDGDGIGDTPYSISADNQDRYPLMEPWRPTAERLLDLIETIEMWNLPQGIENSLTSKLREAFHLLDTGNVNGALNKLMDFIDHVEALRDKKLTDEQADYLTSEAQRIIDLIYG